MSSKIFSKGLIIAVIVLIINMSITSTGFDIEKSTHPYNGNTLYVGGDGPGNYTKIQDAIDDASDGDTVFVYSGYYSEGVITVEKSINIIGEDKNTTIVNGYGHWCVFLFQGKNNVKLSGFTIQNAYQHNKYGSGVYVYSSNHIICGNIIQNNDCTGIRLDWSNNNHIYDNIIKNNGVTDSTSYNGGIRCWSSNQNLIEKNIFENNTYGIYFSGGEKNFISNNDIKKSTKSGIYHSVTAYNEIISNHITDNNDGVYLNRAFKTLVTKNNIYGNKRDGYFVRFGKNIWRNNYWGSILPLVKIIRGVLQFPIKWDPITGEVEYKNIKWIQLDWLSAKEPYDVGA